MVSGPEAQLSDPKVGYHPANTKHRRPHKKTRSGCLGCRRRRVKCDERNPSCRACVRREQTCEWPVVDANDDAAPGCIPDASQRASRELSHTSSPSSSVPSSTLQALLSPVSSYPCDIEDLALLHHWTWHTSLSIYRESGPSNTWQYVIPTVGFEHPFVLHAILSLAALHIVRAWGTEASSSAVNAAEHHSKPLRGFQQSMTNITATNSEALVACAILNVLYVFGLGAHVDQDGKDGPPRTKKEDLILGVEWIPMVRGIEQLELSTPEAEGFDHHLCRTAQIWNNDNQTGVYDEALETLRRCYHYMKQFKDMDEATIATWDPTGNGPVL
ncbi:hypothetical protein CC79DRAFT_1364649 [Sarocladium strictum]